MPVVYADVLWLIDFSMDLLSLGLAGRMTERPARGWRLCAAAALGGIWSVLALIRDISGIGGLLLDLLAAVGMVALAFGRMSPFRFWATVGSFFLVSLLLGGSMTALSHLLEGLRTSASPAQGGGFALLALAGAGITRCGAHLRRRLSPRCATVELRYGTRKILLEALVDSGNLLRDPVSGRGVIFVSPSRLRELLDEPIGTLLCEQSLDALTVLPREICRRFCLLPSAETVQGKRTLIAFRPDAVLVNREPVSALLCPALSGPEGEYAAIIPTAYVSETLKIPIHIGKKR